MTKKNLSGRQNYKEKAVDRGRRIIFEGEIRGNYRTAEFITASRNRKYQYGLTGHQKNQLIEIINF